MIESIYPEATWVSLGLSKPVSQFQWLNKNLPNVEPIKTQTNANGSYLLKSRLGNYTTGSGSTTNGIYIHHQIACDYLKEALKNKIWNYLYQQVRVYDDRDSVQALKNHIQWILESMVSLSVISSFVITNVGISSNKFSLFFDFTLDDVIISVNVKGNIGI